MSFPDFSPYWIEFAAIATLHFFAVASPGPDFAVVLKQSISSGRRSAMFTSVGVGVGILIHVAYSLLGIGILIKTTPWLFQAFAYIAAAYLLYLGWGAIRSKATPLENSVSFTTESTEKRLTSDKKSFLIGLMTNGLNPKATLFFLTVFAVAVSPHTPVLIKLSYGLYLAFATGVWFCFLSYLMSGTKIRSSLQKNGYIFDRFMGVILIVLAVNLVFST
ncbi:LysE family translocator [Aliiglaciecola sp. 3_MG-2023]|uniref:LysE family translocator n=1 Tax=Aliiglaciecola sp. 3_MG-2023 TaxID=3062644 RepID=UPI0026E13B61|nr:LysE family translocator [Aliiglaciecola sp. 3_MG-2023]MDO6692586.1 LysE family translocator [Aliiglaciecola sp. 3_MG-2023]